MPYSSPTPASVTPQDIPGSSAITHMLLARDKAFLCHSLGPGFKGGKEGIRIRALCSGPHPLTCGPATDTPMVSVGVLSTQTALSLQFPSEGALGTGRRWALQRGAQRPFLGWHSSAEGQSQNQAAPAPLQKEEGW